MEFLTILYQYDIFANENEIEDWIANSIMIKATSLN